MVSKRKALAPLLVALGLALGVFGLLLPDTGSVAAQATPSATRSLSATSVAPGAQVDVSISASGYGQAGAVTETLPSGFTYVSSNHPTSQVTTTGQDVRFTLFGETSLTYTVTASSVPNDDYRFEGTLRDFSRNEHTVGGDSTIAVVADDPGNGGGGNGGTTPPVDGDPAATRSISASQVDAGGTLNVTVDASNYGQAGAVTETLPSGFTYGSSTHPGSQVTTTGQDVRFTLFGETSVSYTVTASSQPGTYSFSGVLTDFDRTAYDVGGDTDVSVLAAAGGPSASRSFPSEYVAPDGELVVTVSASNYGQFGAVTETLPAGFAYLSSSHSDVSASGQTVRFSLFGESSFTYTVTAPSAEGPYTFSGVLRDSTRVDHPMADSTIMVGTAPVSTPDPTPTTTPDETPGPTDPTSPTRTPRATPRPSAPSTPVAIEIVSDVTMAEGATVVQPDASSVVSSSDGMATVMLPNTSRARTYQVMVSSDAAGCSGGDLAGAMQACVTITSYDAEGNMESGVMLIRRATVVMTLDAAAVEDLGGLPVVFQANALGAFSVYQRDDADDSWGMRRSTMGLTDDGGIAVTVTSLRSLGSLALAVDEEILQTAMYQVAGITPTPVRDSDSCGGHGALTAVPTAVPTPVPTAVPPEVEPEVGDTTLPVGLLVVLALTGALMVYTGSRVMRRKPVATRR